MSTVGSSLSNKAADAEEGGSTMSFEQRKAQPSEKASVTLLSTTRISTEALCSSALRRSSLS
jgi:hypothetical protein